MNKLIVDSIFEDRYQIKQFIPGGQMSRVYKALDKDNNNDVVAVKIINTEYEDKLIKEFFRRDTESLSRLTHPNIIQMLNSGYSQELKAFYLILEYLPYNLKYLLEKKPKIVQDPNWIWPFIRSLADGLGHAHSEGIIHRDIKPSNILLDEAYKPKITDFGISRIKYKLSIGATVSSFWSPGYAAPEQQAGKQADTWSDIYSLGAVCYHILTLQPPVENDSLISDIGKLNIPESIKIIIYKMLAKEPLERFQRISDLMVELNKTSRLEQPRTCYLVITEAAKQKLLEIGCIQRNDFSLASEYLIDDLGGPDVKNTNITLGQYGDIIILGRKLRLICKVDENSSACTIIDLNYPYQPKQEKQRESTLSVRIIWEPVSKSYYYEDEEKTITESRNTIDWLLDCITEHDRIASTEAISRQQKRQFTDIWDKVLKYEQIQIEKQNPRLDYKSVIVENNGIISFNLIYPAPDSIDWIEDTPIAIIDEDCNKRLYIGTLLEIKGDKIVVNTNDTKFTSQRRQIQPKGKITRDLTEALASIRRQQFALNLFRSKEIASPNLADILIEPSRATFSPVKNIEFIQYWFDDNKKTTIQKALSADDMFIIKGPPGTGKTSVIAEIIIQILRFNEKARILVTSQSNIAVDHVLAKIAILDPSVKEMVRIGREEKMGSEAESWLIENRLSEWQKAVEVHCSSLLDKLNQEKKNLELLNAQNNKSDNTEHTEANVLFGWIEETGYQLESLRTYELEYVQLRRDIEQNTTESPESQNERKITLKELEIIVLDQSKLVSDYLDTIRGLLPLEFQGDKKNNLEDEFTRLKNKVAQFVKSTDPSAFWTNRIQLIKDWMRIFGKTDDFNVMVTKNAKVLAATCIFSAKRAIGDQLFDWAIIDEAGRATAPELLVPLVRSRRVILVGDERQLPPFLDEEITEDNLRSAGIEIESIQDIENSLFQELIKQASISKPEMVAMLNKQYRMHPAIGRLVSNVFYDGMLENGIEENKRNHCLSWIPKPIVWYSTNKLPQHREIKIGLSFANPCETSIIEHLINRIESDYRKMKKNINIGIISGYSAQIKELTIKIDPKNNKRWESLNIDIATVDSFQGQDRDIIICSTVRSNTTGKIGFMRDRRRVNVSMSRAKSLLIIVGDHLMMEYPSSNHSTNPFKDILAHIKKFTDDCTLVDWVSEND